MKKKLKNLIFQNKAVDFGFKYLQKNKIFRFQSPTGSGKTFILSMLIEKILSNFYYENYTFIFIAPSIGQLDYQAYEKISNYIKRGWVKSFSTKYIGTKNTKKTYLQNINIFKKNYIYFLGWGLFGKNTNLINFNTENNNLFNILEKTKIKKTKIILIIDEAHREYKKIDSKTKKNILSYIDPEKIIETSATLDNFDYKISLQEVRNEFVIKKNIILNCSKDSENFTKKGRIEEVEFLVSEAILKQKKIKIEYFKKNISLKPLILIQIPNNPNCINDIENIKIDDFYINQIEKILINKGYKEKLSYAIWCSDRKTFKDKKKIISNDSNIEFLIFKQAIATGWDIPRANILVKIREAKSPKFIIQTLGRILRNPFLKYYNNDYIDNAFVFTKDEKYKSKIENEEFIISNIIKIKISSRGKKIQKNLNLNKILYNVKFDFEHISDLIFKEIVKNKKLLNEIIIESKKKEIDSTGSNFAKLDPVSLFEKKNDDIVEKEFQKKIYQRKLNFFQYSDTLLEIFLKYKLIISKNLIINNVIEKLSEFLSKKQKLSKKFFYKFIIYKFNKTILEKKTIFEWIIEIKDKKMNFLYKKNIFKKEKFFLNDFIKISDKKIIIDQFNNKNVINAINTYELDLKIKFFSKNEKNFYIKIWKLFFKKEHLHLFKIFERNECSYFIEYFDKNLKKLKFYPDFFLINNNKKRIWIIEIKDRKDIDKNTDYKQKQMEKIKNKISNNFDIEFFILRNENNSENLEFLDSKGKGYDFFKKIKEFF